MSGQQPLLGKTDQRTARKQTVPRTHVDQREGGFGSHTYFVATIYLPPTVSEISGLTVQYEITDRRTGNPIASAEIVAPEPSEILEKNHKLRLTYEVRLEEDGHPFSIDDAEHLEARIVEVSWDDSSWGHIEHRPGKYASHKVNGQEINSAMLAIDASALTQ